MVLRRQSGSGSNSHRIGSGIRVQVNKVSSSTKGWKYLEHVLRGWAATEAISVVVSSLHNNSAIDGTNVDP